jgi:hypothetical protein
MPARRPDLRVNLLHNLAQHPGGSLAELALQLRWWPRPLSMQRLREDPMTRR